MMACSCKKGRNNVSKGCMKKVRAWQNIDNDVAKCQAGIGGHSNGETTLICKRYQVMDFASVGMNAASVGEEFRMLLKHVTSFQIFEKSSYNIGAKEKKQQKQKPRRKDHLQLVSNL